MSDRQVFIDASFWIALRETRDERHPYAEVIANELHEQRFGMVCTSFVFAEVHAHFSRYPRLRQMIIEDFFDSPIMQYENPSIADQQKALDILRVHRDKSFSFFDAVSFVVMERLGLKRVVTFDRHFEQFGDFEIIN
jgi:predicted nucleic acid-binding protein